MTTFALAACGQLSGPPAGEAMGGGGGGGGFASGGASGGLAEVHIGLQYDGALVMNRNLVVTPEPVAISAPILPRTGVIYQPFPTTIESERIMAHDASLIFDWLLAACAPLYPGITLVTGGASLTPAQLSRNYGEVGRCSYEQYAAKPYWIPKLVDDVDICGTALGNAWSLITEDDLARLTSADFELIRDTLVPIQGTIASTGFEFFFGSVIWVRARDGSIASATLDPDAGADRVVPLGNVSATEHYEGNLSLRCIRRGTSF